MTENRKPPTREHRDKTKEALRAALGQICDSWSSAKAAHQARGFGHRSPGPKAAAPVVKVDANDPLHTRQMPLASGGKGGHSDPTGDASMQPDRAEIWLASATGHLRELLKLQPDRWVGAFNPPAMKDALQRAGDDLVEWWPNNAGHFIDQIIRLGGIAVTEWPPTPEVGDEIDTPEGTIRIGAAQKPLERCGECQELIEGGAADPLARIDGKPYHRNPCYHTVYMRNRRKAGKGAAA